jgi:hypothetical protein
MTLSSERWYDASVDAGADPAEARVAADSTTAFYTGTAVPDAGGGGTSR